LFICNGNVARSQEAEAFFNALTVGRHQAVSAGINVQVGKPLDPMVVEVMSEVGYRMDGCVRKVLDSSMVDEADLMISFKPLAEFPIDLATCVEQAKEFRYWAVADPRGRSLDFHRKTRICIEGLVRGLFIDL
jgi:protein-tyrosine-phosphatase